MKLGLFSDMHYCNCDCLGLGRMPRLAFARFKAAMQTFKDAGVDTVICLGDFTDRAEGEAKEDTLSNFRSCVSIIRDFGMKFYLVPGNHDFLTLTRADMKNEGACLAPFCIRDENVCIVALDANYRADMRHFDVAGEKWDDANVPSEQLRMLDDTLEASDTPCIVLIHENLDPCIDFSHQVRNAAEVREVISKHADKVKTVIQGHFHWGAQDVYDGVDYLTLKSISVFDKDYCRIIEI